MYFSEKYKVLKKGRKIVVAVGIGVLILVVIGLSLNAYIKSEIENELENEFQSSTINYDELNVNVWGGNTSINNLVYIQDGIHVEAREIGLNGFNYTDYFFNDEIVIDHIEIIEPVITINTDTTQAGKEEEQKETPERNLRIKKLSITGGNFKMIENDSASNSLFLAINAIVLEEISVNQKTSEGKLPFDYENVNIETDSLYFDLNAEHYLTLQSLKNNSESQLSITNFKIVPKYDKAEFDQKIPYEKDKIQLEVPEITLKDFSWELKDSLVIKSSETLITDADLQIYRNKFLPDENRVKPLYSKMIREMDFKIQLDTLKVQNASIVYEENVLESRPPGTLKFDNVNATVNHISNLNMDSDDFKETRVSAEALFMEESQVAITWDFDIRNLQDEFNIKGNLASISADAVNPFLKPTMNVEVEGEIESLYFNFFGNNSVATGDMQLSYKDFKVNILEDGEEKEKSFLSGLANFFLKNDRLNEDVEQEKISVERDQTKSFWNFLWLSIQEGTIKTFL